MLITGDFSPFFMDWVVFGAVLGCFGAIIWVLKEAISLRVLLTAPAEEGQELDLTPLIEGIDHAVRAGIKDEVQKTVGRMEPPSAQDHLFGMISQFFQMKMLKSMGNIEGLPTLTPENGTSHTNPPKEENPPFS